MINLKHPKSGKKFPETSWTDIDQWPHADTSERQQSMARFFVNYKSPLINFIISSGYPPDQAEDIFQDFITSHIEKKGAIFTSADSQKGRFRNLLLTALKRFIIDWQRRNNAQKRKPMEGIVHFDSMADRGIYWEDVISKGSTPEQIFENAWLLTLLNNVTEMLRKEFVKKGQSIHFEIFRLRVIDPIFLGAVKPSIRSIADQFCIKESTAANNLVTAKRAYQRFLQKEIRTYVRSEKEVTLEINDLLSFTQHQTT